jgi:hypothetical protein
MFIIKVEHSWQNLSNPVSPSNQIARTIRKLHGLKFTVRKHICTYTTSCMKISIILSTKHQFKHCHVRVATSAQWIRAVPLCLRVSVQYNDGEKTRRKTEEYWYLSRGPDLVKTRQDKLTEFVKVEQLERLLHNQYRDVLTRRNFHTGKLQEPKDYILQAKIAVGFATTRVFVRFRPYIDGLHTFG